MKIRHVLIALAGITLSSAALASDWYYIGASGKKPSRNVILIDKAGMRGTGSIVRAWDIVYRESSEGGIRYTKTLEEYNCSERSSALISATNFGNDNEVMDSYTWNPAERETKYASPDSVGDTVLSFVCGKDVGAMEIGEIGDPAVMGQRVIRLLDTP